MTFTCSIYSAITLSVHYKGITLGSAWVLINVCKSVCSGERGDHMLVDFSGGKEPKRKVMSDIY